MSTVLFTSSFYFTPDTLREDTFVPAPMPITATVDDVYGKGTERATMETFSSDFTAGVLSAVLWDTYADVRAVVNGSVLGGDLPVNVIPVLFSTTKTRTIF